MKSHIQLGVLFAAAILSCCSVGLSQENWPQLHGPSANSHADSAKLPVHWDDQKNVAWKTPIHGRGWSSPVIFGDQIWMGTATPDGTEFYAVCVDKRTGKILHDKKLFSEEKPRFCHSMNSYASPTPVIEAGRVYFSFGSYGTACLNTADGSELWRRTDFKCNHFRGPGSSPILYNDLLIMHFDGFDFQYIVAVDKSTGKTVWKKDRDIDYKTDNGDIMKAFSTPLVIQVDGKDQLISPTSKAMISYAPKTGEEIWRIRYPQFSATARPMLGPETIYINTGFGSAQLYSVKLGGKGDVTDSHVNWKIKKGIGSKPSAILKGNRIFAISDKGVFSCINAKSGKYLYSKRIGGQFSSSPLLSGENIYLCSHDGVVTVVKAKDEFEKVAENKMPSGIMSSLAVSGDVLFIRTKTDLYRIENK